MENVKRINGWAMGLCIAVALMLATGMAALAPSQAFAGDIGTSKGAKAYMMNANKTYKKGDLTGNKKVDKVKYTLKKGKFTLYVKGKKAYSKSGVKGANVMLVKLKNGKSFVQVDLYGKNYRTLVTGLFQYKSGKMKQIINYKNLLKGTGKHLYYASVMSVDGNTVHIYAEANEGGWASATYTYKNKTLKKISSTPYAYGVVGEE